MLRPGARTAARRLHRFLSGAGGDAAPAARSALAMPTATAYARPRQRPTMTAAEFAASYGQCLSPGQHLEEQHLWQTGRVHRKRQSGGALLFVDLTTGDGGRVQVKCSRAHLGDGAFDAALRSTPGDYVAVQGFPSSSLGTGQLLLCAHDLYVTAPCRKPIPPALASPEARQRQRHLDLLVNRDTVRRFRQRAAVVSCIRAFLDDRGFLEVETPVLWSTAGGANARPFETRGVALASALELRVAPELFLKQLIVGGLDRVYEIGKVFRNEGMDRTHHPEFTSCEFYMADANYEDLMPMTEALLAAVSSSLGSDAQVAFAGPFERLDVVGTIEKQLNLQPRSVLAILEEPDESKRQAALLDIASGAHLQIPAAPSSASLLEAMIAQRVEPLCVSPTFLVNHPTLLCPLAKQSNDNGVLADRFELFVKGQELCNAYSELADPDEQRRRFKEQERLGGRATPEIAASQAEYCDCLEYGLPPTAGWGMGIDRLVMLLTGADHIRDVVLFPALRAQHR
ncbi:Lysine--tRNA ligase [Plasmodiophora brassicae]